MGFTAHSATLGPAAVSSAIRQCPVGLLGGLRSSRAGIALDWLIFHMASENGNSVASVPFRVLGFLSVEVWVVDVTVIVFPSLQRFLRK